MKRKRGFTLVELLLVIAVIGVIMSLLAPALVTVKRRARAIQCASRLHQIGIAIETYGAEHNSVLAFVTIGPEARLHPQRWYDPRTRVPSLSHFLECGGALGESARCVADTGCPGQSVSPTPPGVSCYDGWGQSMLYNSSCYVDAEAPGFNARSRGSLYGANPVRLDSVTRNAEYLLASDFWAHWHYGGGANARAPYYTNLLFFDGHVVGRYYPNLSAARAYLNWDGVRRWWIPNPEPLSSQ